MTDIAKLNIEINSQSAKTATQDLDELSRAGKKTESSMGSLSNGAAKLSKSIAAAAAVAATLSAGAAYLTKQLLNATAEIQRNANMAGISTKAYQELSYAAKQHGITQDAITDGIKEMTLRFEEFAKTGSGPGKEAIETLRFRQENLNELLKDTPGLLQEVVRRMEGLGQAAKLRIADEIFGGEGGEQFTSLINAGADSLENMMKKAHELGLVMDADLIKQSKEAKLQVDALSDVLSMRMQVAVAELAPLISTLAEDITDLVVSITGSSGFVYGLSVVVDAVAIFLRTFELAGKSVALIFASMNALAWQLAGVLVAGPIKALEYIVELYNKIPALPDISLPSGLTGFADTIISETEIANQTVIEAVKDISDLLIRPLPGNAIRDSFHDINEAIKSTTETAPQKFVEITDAQKKAFEAFNEEYKKATLSTFDYEIEKLDEKHEERKKLVKAGLISESKLHQLYAEQYFAIYEEDVARYVSAQERKSAAVDKALQDFFSDIDKAQEYLIKKQEKAQEEIVKAQQEAYDDLYDTVYDFTRDVIDDFDNMGDTLVDLAKSIVKDIAAAFLAQNIVMPITMAVGSSFGLTGSGGVPYSAMAGGNGYGSIFGGMPSGNTLSWIGNNVPGMGFMSSAMGSIVPGSTMGGAIQAGTGLSSGVTWGTALGAGAISGLGYSMLGGALGLPQSEYSGLTAGLGGAAMSAYGGSLASMTGIGMLGGPIGIGIGALLGGLAGGLFGGSEPEPRIGIRKGDISDFGYNPTTKDMSNQKPINEYIVKYFDSYFSAIDELTSNSVKDVLENTKWERIRVHPDDFDTVEDAIFAVSSDVFEKFADGFISGLADGQLAGYLDENFFGSIKTENENLLDSFIRFGIVLENTDDFVFQFTRQIDDFGTSTVQAFNNVSAITAIMGQVEVGIDSIANVSAITTLDNLTASWNDLLLSLEAANATTEQLARTQTGMAQALGANMTGLTADTLQAALMSGGDIDSILTSSIQSASYTSIAQDIAETYINNLNEEIGRVWIDSGGNINDVISAMQSLDTTDVRNEIEQLQLSFGLLTDDIEEVSDVIPEAVLITNSAEQELNAAQNALNKAQDQYADAINYQIGLLNDEIDQIQDEIDLKEELIRENENLLDSFKYLKEQLSEFQTDLVLSESEDPEYQLAYAKSLLDTTVQKLYSSNQDDVAEALADLPEVSRQYLDVSKKTNVNELDQLQALGYVQEILNTSQDIASVQVGRTEDTLYELNNQNTILLQNQSYYERQITSLEAIKAEISGTNDLLNLSLEQAKQNYDDAVSNLYDATDNYNNGAASTGVDDENLGRYENIVRNMFQAVFGNNGTQSERDYWVNALVDQTDDITLTNFKDTFISNAKYSDRVEQAFLEAFKRPATGEELLYWVKWANAQSDFVGLYDIEQALRAYGEGIPAMASGGTVTAPTLALIGEGGQPEHVIPDSQMQGVKDRLDKIHDLLWTMLNLSGDKKESLEDLLDIFERNVAGSLPLKTEAA